MVKDGAFVGAPKVARKGVSMIQGEKAYKQRAHLYLTDTTRDLCCGVKGRAATRAEIITFVEGLMERWDGVYLQEDHNGAVLTFTGVG